MAKWTPGMASPNPSGRPKGIVDRRLRIAKAMLEDADDVVSVVMEKAKEGDMSAAALVLARVAPGLRLTAPLVEFDFDRDDVKSLYQVESVLQAVADGKVTADVAKQIIDAISQLAGVRQVDELESRIRALEEHRR